MTFSFHLGNKRFLPEFIPLSGGRNDKRAGMSIAAQPIKEISKEVLWMQLRELRKITQSTVLTQTKI